MDRVRKLHNRSPEEIIHLEEYYTKIQNTDLNSLINELKEKKDLNRKLISKKNLLERMKNLFNILDLRMEFLKERANFCKNTTRRKPNRRKPFLTLAFLSLLLLFLQTR